jgi:FtsZ-binding cell division protein ZapB
MHAPQNQTLKHYLQNLASTDTANRSDLLALIQGSKQSVGLDRLLPETTPTKRQALNYIIRAIKLINENDSHYNEDNLPDNHPHQHVLFAPLSAAANYRRTTLDKAGDQTLSRLRRCLYSLLNSENKLQELAPFFVHHPVFQRYTHTGFHADDTREMAAIISICPATSAPRLTTSTERDSAEEHPAVIPPHERLQQIEDELAALDRHPDYATALQQGIAAIRLALQAEMSELEATSPQVAASFEAAHSISQLHRDNAPYAPTPRTCETRDAKYELEVHFDQHAAEKTETLKQKLQQEQTDREHRRAQLTTERDQLTIAESASSFGAFR